MRIGIDITARSGGRGPGRYVTEIVSALARLDLARDAFFLYSPSREAAMDRTGLIARHVPPQRGRPWLNWTLPRAVRRDAIDLMYFPANDIWLWPHVTTVATVLDVAPATALRGIRRSWADRIQNRMQMARLEKVASRVITISRYSAGQIQRLSGIPAARISVIPCGVSAGYAPPPPGEPRDTFLLFVGAFDRRKNLERLLDAHAILRQQGFAGKLVLAGQSRPASPGGLYIDIRALVMSKHLEGSVEIIENPSDDDVIRLYRTAALFVFPSLVEGFGLPVLEAMACGCPVVCSNVVSLPEVGGDAVRYFDPLDAADIARKVTHLLNDAGLRLSLGNKGRDRAIRFSWDEAGERTYQLLMEASCR